MGILVLAILVALLVAPAGAEEQPLWKTIKGWQVRVDQSLGMGCFVVKVSGEGSVLRIGNNPNTDSSHLILLDPIWRSIEAGKIYSIEVKFGGEAPWVGDATGIVFPGLPEGSKALWLDFTDPLFVEEFMSEESLTVRYRDNVIAEHELANSYAAGAAMAECQQIFDEIANKLDPFGSSSDKEGDPFDSP